MSSSKRPPENAPTVGGVSACPLLHLTRSGTGRIGPPARCTRLGHQARQYLCFAVEHSSRILTAQYDKLERVHEYLVKLAIPPAKADRRRRRQCILCRLHLFDRCTGHPEARLDVCRQLHLHHGEKPYAPGGGDLSRGLAQIIDQRHRTIEVGSAL